MPNKEKIKERKRNYWRGFMVGVLVSLLGAVIVIFIG
jgi:hypothetical protein